MDQRLLLIFRWPFLVGFVATGGIFLNIALGITGTVKLWSGALKLKIFYPLELTTCPWVVPDEDVKKSSMRSAQMPCS